MTGKEKCNVLRKIRRQIAENNGILFYSPDCTFEGNCIGTCPKCDDELCQLEQVLEERNKDGLRVDVVNLCCDILENGMKNE